jgi:hypothetical protein
MGETDSLGQITDSNIGSHPARMVSILQEAAHADRSPLTGRKAGRRAGRQASRQAGRQAGREAGMQLGGHAGR